ncbi:acyltransferase domain-containing protein [Bacillus sp. SPARC3]|uniref:type I polyketide synthase n=1 Tax=Bacillus sp. SPARC3 TaxID=2841275 RepID=UPI001C935DD7|nr:type I polyketide synthase [Bacillus sp. SPARC3]MBY4605685.1 acyltransferase domain-containing protein [Bacillus sp. SPARC3]
MADEKQWTETGLEIAVVGMAGKFPGAANIDEYWSNISKGIESVTQFTDEELKDAGVDETLLRQEAYVKAKPIIDEVSDFDAEFFGYSPREAALMDPQIRLMHECTWEALEHAGCDAERFNGLIGLYAGASSNLSWMGRHMSSLHKNEDAFQIMHLNDSSFASRIAYKLNLKGPSVSVQTACSTSLVAIHMACQGLIGGECDLALAGGVTLSLPHISGYLYQEGMIYSADGHCRPFDEKANGTIFGEGAGVVALKRLKDAQAEGDVIYAVIKGSAINNDGNNKAGYTAPSAEGQANVIATAMEMAETEPESIGYVEAHGTGTPVGDPIEIEALTRAFNTDKKAYCRIGSVKANIGHLDAASGVAGFIKTVMMLHHKMLPPAFHYQKSNPRIKFENTPFFVNTELTEWESLQGPRRAGVSAFGIGGANAHVVLEEPPSLTDEMPAGGTELVVLSARTRQELTRSMDQLADFLRRNPEAPLPAIARTLQLGRKQFQYRISFVASHRKDLLDQISEHRHKKQITESAVVPSSTLFVFAGDVQEGFGRYAQLYRTENLFKKEVDACLEKVQNAFQQDVLSFFKACISAPETYQEEENLGLVHALSFIMEYAAVRFLQHIGITPDRFIGRGFGEFTAACAAGMFSFEEGAAAAYKRGELINMSPAGKMLGVSLSEPDIVQYLEKSLSLALIDERYCAVSGLPEDVYRLKARLEQEGIAAELLDGDIAYQSDLLVDAAEEFMHFLGTLDMKSPDIPVVSSVTGKVITDDEAADSSYWAGQICKPIRFFEHISSCLREEPAVCIDLRLTQGASVFTERQSIGMTGDLGTQGHTDVLKLHIYGALWSLGSGVDFSVLHEPQHNKRLALPTYPFTKQHFPLPDGFALAELEEDEPRKPAEPFRAMPLSAIEKTIREIVIKHFGFNELNDDAPFFELGATSLDISQLAAKLTDHLKWKVEPVLLYQFAAVRSLAKHLHQQVQTKAGQPEMTQHQKVSQSRPNGQGSDIAIIGMAGRFPGAGNLDEFWNNLVNGKESISFFTDEELKASGIDDQLLQHPDYVKAKGIIEDSDMFDADFFQYSSREAELMDPQFRLLHECAWEALEDAGCNPERTTGKIGVYTGTSPNLEWITRFAGKLDGTEQFSSMLLNDREFFSTQLAYKLNLHGPSITMQTACSTSLVNIGEACQALQNGACDAALAGGVTVSTPLRSGYVYQDGMIQSPDGHCRPFDEDAGGTVFGDGAGIVVLKRYEDAVKEGHTIYAVIKGVGMNNDGSRKVGFTAPSVEGQAEVLKNAYENAGIDPNTVGYIEAHGTGTKMGDPIEMEALSQVFKSDKPMSIPIGSVKSNVGHLNSAAGIAGLFKAVLSLKHKTILPSLNYTTPNPHIHFDRTPFYVNTETAYWKESTDPRRAGVSSFGIGGTNAHIVLEEEPESGREASESQRHLLVLSAKTDTALEQMTNRLKEFLRTHPNVPLEDVAYTLQVGRKQFSYRKAVVLSKSTEWESGAELTAYQRHSRRPAAFMFSGQGTQYIDMMKDLYEAEPVFQKEADRCFAFAQKSHQIDLKAIVFPDSNDGAKLTETAVVQPLLFIFEYALAKLLQSAGISPDYMIGHSIGEYTAACLSGVFALDTALTLVMERGRLMQKLESGAMMSVQLSEVELQPLLTNSLSLAAVNAHDLCVVSGKSEDIETFAVLLEEKGVAGRQLHTSHAFHSYMMEPILEEFAAIVKQQDMNTPRIPFVSNVTGTWITPEQAADPAYWSQHLRGTVRFHEGLGQILSDDNVLLIEVGPGSTLSTFARRHKKRSSQHDIVNLVRHVQEPAHDHSYFLKKLGQLWVCGCEIDWRQYGGDKPKRLISLPPYPFEKKRYWIEAADNAAAFTAVDEWNKKKPMDQWFYLPSWDRKIKSADSRKKEQPAESGKTLVFHEGTAFGDRLVQSIRRQGHETVIVTRDRQFKKINSGLYVINPADGTHYERLFSSLASDGLLPNCMMHLWSVSEQGESFKTFSTYSENGYYSLIFTAQAASNQKQMNECNMFVLTSGIHEVTGEEQINAEKSTILGPLKVIPQEYNHLKCWNIDIPPLPDTLTWKEEELIDQILTETDTAGEDQIIAYRNRRRWVQMYQPVQLNKATGLPNMIRPKGVYLITGGLGGIGFVLSKLLAQEGNVRLILTGRSELPQRSQWESWCEKHEEDDPITAKILKIKELERLGAKVTTLQADAGSLSDMQAVMRKVHTEFGQLNGVFHAAGLPGSSSFRAITDIPATIEGGEDQFQSKVRGLKVLESLLENENIDFCFLFSSISALLGGLGFSAYSAANIYMDAFAARVNQRSKTPWVCVNWDAWNFWGQLESTIGESIAELAILPEEGAALFQYVLSDINNRHLLVSTGDLGYRMKQWISMNADSIAKEEKKTGALHTRPELNNPYVAPRNKTEQVICGIWQDFMGLEQVGIHDNFFDLGASSLDIVQVTNRLNKELGTNEAVVTLFTYPSVAALAQFIGPDQEESEEEKEEMAAVSKGRRKTRIRNQRDKRLRGGE